MQPPLVAASGISKTFGPVRALEDVGISVRPASFHAVVGENGAGKSTLAKCILGFYRADAGEVQVGGEAVRTPLRARQTGLGMVFQHFTLAPSLTVLENLLLARQDLPLMLDLDRERAEAQAFLKSAPFSIDLSARIQNLSAGEKQKVEILKQLYLRTRVLILDEPTSVLTPAESDEVMAVLRSMVDSGSLSVLLVTHKFREVMTYADEVTIMRRGRYVATYAVRDVTAEQIAELMMGNSASPVELEKLNRTIDEAALTVRNLEVRNDLGLVAVKRMSFTLRRGEILGIAGISGNGQRELVQGIGGQRPIESGEVEAFGVPYVATREGIRAAGLFTLPEEPLQNATVPAMSVAENLALRDFDKPPFASQGFFLNRDVFRRKAAESIEHFSIRTPSETVPICNLSGGNVQRAVLARDLGSGKARILVVANPCFGLDMGATAFVHQQLLQLRNAGGSVLLVSEDLEELSKLADRILVMSAGTAALETTPRAMDVAVVGRLMGGHH